MPQGETKIEQYPAAMVNITNRCTLRCRHCFVFRDGNPNEPKNEMATDKMIDKLSRIKKERGILTMLWMGGEPLLRPDVLREGVKIFQKNTITTNGTIELIDLPNSMYVVSLDGPPEINDSIRGKGTFKKVMKNISRIPEKFAPLVMCQCVVTRSNETRLEELVELLRPTSLQGMTFSFYTPTRVDNSDLTWGSLERRDKAVYEVMRLKEKYPDFVWNNRRALELTLSKNSRSVTENCPSKKLVLPLYLEGEDFVQPFCCYGNDVDCDLCGAWVVFYLAAKMENRNIA